MIHESPGSIKWQVGQTLTTIRDAITREEVTDVANNLRLLVALAAPVIPRERRAALRPPSVADVVARAEADGADPNAVLLEECMIRLEDLLELLAEKDLYARTLPPTEDASFLRVRDPRPTDDPDTPATEDDEEAATP